MRADVGKIVVKTMEGAGIRGTAKVTLEGSLVLPEKEREEMDKKYEPASRS